MFADAYRLDGTQRAAITGHAVQIGLLAPVTRYLTEHHDTELDEVVAIEHGDPGAAASEAAEYRCEVLEVHTVTATTALLELAGWPAGDPGSATSFDLALIALVSEGRGDLDGVWFDDRLDPAALSAPRGALTTPQRWHITRT